jgi:hypothetical protein
LAAKNDAEELCEKMKKAWESDWKSNESKRPALQKLTLIDQVTRDLRKGRIAQQFIDCGG